MGLRDEERRREAFRRALAIITAFVNNEEGEPLLPDARELLNELLHGDFAKDDAPERFLALAALTSFAARFAKDAGAAMGLTAAKYLQLVALDVERGTDTP